MSPQSKRVAFLIFFAVLTVLFLLIARPFAKAALLGATLAIVFSPLHQIFFKGRQQFRYGTAFVTMLLVGACVILPVGVLGVVVVTKAGAFLQLVATQVETGLFSEKLALMFGTFRDGVEQLTGVSLSATELQQTVLKMLKMTGQGFYEFSPRMILRTASFIGNFFLMFLFLFVFLAEGNRLGDWLEETLPLSTAHWRELARDMRQIITSSLGASFFTGIAQGALLGLGFWVAGFQEPFDWGLVAMLACMIPMIGAASCYFTAALLLMTIGNLQGAILFLLYGVGVVSTVDNVIRTFLVRGSGKIHPMLLFVTLVGGVRLMGSIGLLAGPLILAAFLASIRIYRREFAKTV